jgi:hypothetical protein
VLRLSFGLKPVLEQLEGAEVLVLRLTLHRSALLGRQVHHIQIYIPSRNDTKAGTSTYFPASVLERRGL